jgi:hypothetical protein
MYKRPPQIQLALDFMDEWLGLPESEYKWDVYRFAQKLPPDEVLEAVLKAQAKVPAGGMPGFKYFCGVCWGKIEDQEIALVESTNRKMPLSPSMQ